MDEDIPSASSKKIGKQHNTLPLCGNESSMNLNPLILANIQGSSYFKVHLFKLKTYHEVVDEIYYQVKHMEPWERGSRKTSGQTGMCGGVRGVGAGGIVSTAFCLLYKLYTLRLTRKQVNGLLNHTDSPYIRALGFIYLRYTQPPADLYDWYEDYLQDEEEIDVKAGGGQIITVGMMVYQFLTKLDWFSTLFPRIPVPIQKQIENKLEQYCRNNRVSLHQLSSTRCNGILGRGNVELESDNGLERRSGTNSNRDPYSNCVNVPIKNHRIEHDRGYPHSSSYQRHREEQTGDCGNSGGRERHREKLQKKRKHHSRSRSRSHNRYDRKRDQERTHTRGRDNYNDRRR